MSRIATSRGPLPLSTVELRTAVIANDAVGKVVTRDLFSDLRRKHAEDAFLGPAIAATELDQGEAAPLTSGVLPLMPLSSWRKEKSAVTGSRSQS